MLSLTYIESLLCWWDYSDDGEEESKKKKKGNGPDKRRNRGPCTSRNRRSFNVFPLFLWYSHFSSCFDFFFFARAERRQRRRKREEEEKDCPFWPLRKSPKSSMPPLTLRDSAKRDEFAQQCREFHDCVERPHIYPPEDAYIQARLYSSFDVSPCFPFPYEM